MLRRALTSTVVLAGVALLWWASRGDTATAPVIAPPAQAELAPVAAAAPPPPPETPHVPPPPRERAPATPPEYVLASDLMMSREDQHARRRAFASPGAFAAYLALDPPSMEPEARLEAQRAMMKAVKAQQGGAGQERVRALAAATRRYQRAVWAAGSHELARWLFERGIELDGAASDGPPRREILEVLACPLREAAESCGPLGYPDCEAAADVATRAAALCESP